MDDTVLKLLVLRELLKESSSDKSDDSDSKKAVLLDVGLKVVRGPNWKWDTQDDGEGHVGTVVEIGKSGSAPDKTVLVQWDNGNRKNYRIGYNSCYDLRTLDNSPLGIRHPTVTCNSCRKEGVIGMRWKCKWCYDYDLCNRCYMSDKHDISHPFLRIQINGANGIEIPRRQNAVKIPLKGIFASAKVVRSTDWKWENQDGGAGKTGTVTSVRGWEDNTDMNACHVSWSATDNSNLYRIGWEAKMDLKYVQEAVEGYYYRDHLPILGDETRAVRAEDCGTTVPKTTNDRRSSESTSRTPDDTNETGSYTGSVVLCQNLKDLFYSDQFCDLTIKVKDRKFEVHKAIICSRSAVFASKVHSMKTTSSLEITDCDSDTFEDVLFYLYTGKLKRLSQANVNDLLRVADKFEMAALKDECLRFKKDGLSVEYVSEFIAAA